MNCETLEPVKGLTGNQLKLIAVVAMLIDHGAWAFLSYADPLTLCLRTVGKLTMPIMAFFVAEGYHHTKNVKRYALRLAVFAVISHVPFNLLMNGGRLIPLPTSVIFTLLCGLLALIVWDKLPNLPLKILGAVLLCAATAEADWSYFGVLFILAFGLFRGDFRKQAVAYAIVAAGCCAAQLVEILEGGYPIQVVLPFLGLFLCLPLLYCYHGRRGGGGPAMKWLFYIAYPAQFWVVLGILLSGYTP